MCRLTISLLGPFQAAIDGRSISGFRTTKVQALLIYLLVQAVENDDHGVGREEAMTLLWPNMLRKSAQVNLRQTLYHLRQAIPDVDGKNGEPVPFILSDRQTVQVNTAARYELDVAAFLLLVGEDDLDELAAAVDLYRGDFLADFYLEDSNQFEAWAARWRGRLQRLVLDTLDRLAAAALERGQSREAAAYSRKALAIDELRESAHRLLIQSLGQMGKRAAALRQYERCRRLLEKELSVGPSQETEAIVTNIRRRYRPGNRETRLPLPVNPLIGREGELEDITTLLGNRAHLVSIVGPGGMGKTHLALEAARQLTNGAQEEQPREIGQFEHVAYIDLVPLSDIKDFVLALAGALNLAFDKGDKENGLRQRVLDALHDKNLLLVLDNFEHMLEATPFLLEILRASPAVRILATSRERLKMQAEHVYPISGLAYSDWTTPVEASRDAAVQLFLYHARRVRPAFRLHSEDLQPLAEILRLTEGMPLALILAAGWVKVLDLVQIAAKIACSIDFLEATDMDVPSRQRSMRAVFGATWGRLNEREKAIFAALSVFRGGFTLEAAGEISGATVHDLLRLVDHSLLVRDEDGRFTIHELLRQFAVAKLDEAGEKGGVLEAHCIHYLHWLCEQLPELKDHDQLNALDRIENEFHNVRASWEYAIAATRWEDIRAASQSLYLYTLIRGRYQEGVELFGMAHQASIRQSNEPEMLAYIYVTAAWHASLDYAAEAEKALAVIPKLQAIIDTISDPFAIAYCRLMMYELPGPLPAAEVTRWMEDAIATFQQAGELFYTALAYHRLGWCHHKNGQASEALQALRQGLTLVQQMEDYYLTSVLLRSVGALTWMVEGLSDEAVRCYREATELQRQMSAWVPYAHSLSEVATIPAWKKGDLVTGRPLLDEALDIAEEQKVPSVKAHVLAEITTHRLMEERYEEALTLSDEVMSLSESHHATAIWSRYQRGIAFLGSGNIEQAIECMVESLERMANHDWSGMLRVLLAFPGVALAEMREYEKAAELLAFGLTDPYTAGRLQADPLISRARVEVEEKLGEEAFAAAWERGRQLDVLEAAADVLKQWAEQE